MPYRLDESTGLIDYDMMDKTAALFRWVLGGWALGGCWVVLGGGDAAVQLYVCLRQSLAFRAPSACDSPSLTRLHPAC